MKNEPCVFIIFGATGDLTQRKLLPALYFLEREKQHDEHFKIICVARKQKTTTQYRKEAEASIKKYSRIKIKDDILKKTLSRILYHQLDFNHIKDYKALNHLLQVTQGKNSQQCKRVFYLAVAPNYFEIIVKKLKEVKLTKKIGKKPFNRVVFEKPFGKDLKSAKKLNNAIRKVFHERQIYRIDHYLGKELVQNLMVLRFANSLFEPLWNAAYIDHVQITVAEEIGIGNRAGYYNVNGSLRDVVQNHIMQLLCLVAMKAPKTLSADHVRDEKVKVLKAIKRIKNPLLTTVKGQYSSALIAGNKVIGYRQEKNIPQNSVISTYFALKLCINNEQWRKVPFYVRTGKRLKERATEIAIVYKPSKNALFRNSGFKLKNNILLVRVQPDEGITLQFNAKVPGNKVIIEDVNMDFCHECKFGPNTPEAYERLLHNVMMGDQTLFTRWDEVEESWKIIDQVAKAWHLKPAYFYKAGTWGPKEADKLIKRDDRTWIIPKKPNYMGLMKL